MKPPRVVGLVAATHREEALDAARAAAETLRRLGCEVLLDQATAHGLAAQLGEPSALYGRADLIVVFGGDGTVVGTARDASGSGTPIIGVNFGSLGFLAEIAADHLDAALGDLVAGHYEVDRRLMLEVRVERADGVEEWAVAGNDVAVTAADKGRVLDLLVYADGHLLCEYPADGLIAATPTGSTAYSLSAGGPVVAPTVEAMLLTPICAHTLSVRPLVVDAATVIRIEVCDLPRMSRSGIVSVDGQIHLDLPPAARLHVRRSAARLHLARLAPSMFVDSLRAKLRWGSRK